MTTTVEPSSPNELPEPAAPLPALEPTADLWNTMPGWGIVTNLLPPELIESRRANRLRKIVAMVAVGIVVLSGLVWGYERWHSGSVNAQLNRARAATTQLTHSETQYNDVVTIKGDVTSVQAELASLMTNDVAVPNLVGELRAGATGQVYISQLTISINAGFNATGAGNSNTAGGTNLNSTANASIGSITLTGHAPSYAAVAEYVDKLGIIPGVAQAYLNSTTAESTGVLFTVQITLDSDLLSGRFATTKTGGH